MPAPEFLFDIAVSGEAPDHRMLTDIMRSVLGYVGLTGDAADRLLEHMQAQQHPAAAGGPCRLRLEAEGGELRIVLSQQGREWRTACRCAVR